VRLFVALEIPSAVRESLAELIRELRPFAPQAKWLRAENLHVTLKFIGEVANERLEAIRTALGEVRSKSFVTLEFRGLGFFPNEKHPRVFWAGIEAPANLGVLVAEIEGATEKPGTAREKRLFSPHLTLARFESPKLSDSFRAAIAENEARDFGSLRTSNFHLIESKLKPSAAEYTTLQTFQFAAEA
jgi:2'-5' RNA ligase